MDDIDIRWMGSRIMNGSEEVLKGMKGLLGHKFVLGLYS